MLRYLYTDGIEFAPWGSVERHKARALEKISESYGIPKPFTQICLQTCRQGDEFPCPPCQFGLTLSLARHTRVEKAGVAADPTRPIQVQHHRRSLQRVHLLVSYPPLLRPVGFPWTDRYPELRELELRQLARVLLSSDSGPTLGLLKAKVRNYGQGELPHAEQYGH